MLILGFFAARFLSAASDWPAIVGLKVNARIDRNQLVGSGSAGFQAPAGAGDCPIASGHLRNLKVP